MALSRRTTLILIVVGILILVGILFHDFLLENFIRPVTLVLWLFWRFLKVFDQHICWGMLVFGIFFYAIYRLVGRPYGPEYKPQPSSNAALELMNFWRTMILITRDEIDEPNILRRSLAKMLATQLTTKQAGANYFDVYTDLKEETIPLPAGMHAFLFPNEHHGNQRSIMHGLNKIRQFPRKWLRHRTGRDVAEYCQSIEQVIEYMETLMEVNHDNP
jgi:hypothetical protein